MYPQKESLSEYGNGWGWDNNTYPHAFDQTSAYQEYSTVPEGTPISYSENGTVMGYCYDDLENTNGQILLSNSLMLSQVSCKANTENAGNYYSWPASTAGGSKSKGNENNSICPRGWQLTVNAASNPKSWYYLIRNAYNVQNNNDSEIRPLPLSFIRSGQYNQGSLEDRATNGFYWSSTASDNSGAYNLYSYGSTLNPQHYANKYRGYSVRCVAH